MGCDCFVGYDPFDRSDGSVAIVTYLEQCDGNDPWFPFNYCPKCGQQLRFEEQQ